MRKFKLFIILATCLSILLLSSCGCNSEEYLGELEKLDECKGNLRAIGNAVFSYQTSNPGQLPESIEILIEQRFLKTIPTCPVSGKKYIYEKHPINKSKFKIKCPNPELHVGTTGPKSKMTKLYYDTDTVKYE